MTILIREIYDAFKEAGVSEETARNAAEAITGYEDRFHHLEREMDRRFNEVEQRFSEMDLRMDRRFNEVEQRFSEMEQRFSEMDLRMEQRFSKMEQRFAKVDGTQRLLQWMMSFNLALVVAVLFLLLRTRI